MCSVWFQNKAPVGTTSIYFNDFTEQDTENRCYATDAEEDNTKMPCSSRNRRNRRNRNRKRIQRPTSPPKDISTSEAEEVDEQSVIISDNHSVSETKELPRAQEVPNELQKISNLSDVKSRVNRNKHKIKQNRVDANSQSCEIINLSTEPLRAEVDHIDGVGIVESGSSQRKNSVVTVVEPLDIVRPSSSELSMINNESENDVVIAHNGVEISEIDSDIDVDNSRTPIISEIDSDRKEDSGDDSETHILSPDEEKNLRNFIEALQLPSVPSQSTHIARHKIDAEKIAATSIPYKKAYKRAILESYYTQSHEARCLDIIQEEDKVSEDSDHSIRDFINEEIGKFRRRSDDHSRRQLSEESDNDEEEWQNKIINVMDQHTDLDGVESTTCNKNDDNSKGDDLSIRENPKNDVVSIEKNELPQNLINTVTEKVTQMTNEIQKDLEMYTDNFVVNDLQESKQSKDVESDHKTKNPFFKNNVSEEDPLSLTQNRCLSSLKDNSKSNPLSNDVKLLSTGHHSIAPIHSELFRLPEQNSCFFDSTPRFEFHCNATRCKTLEALLQKITENAIPSYAFPYYDVLCAITEYNFPNDSFLIFDTISQAILSHNCSKETLQTLPSFEKLNVPKIISDLVKNIQIKHEKSNLKNCLVENKDNTGYNILANSKKDDRKFLFLKDKSKDQSLYQTELNHETVNESNDKDQLTSLCSNSNTFVPADCVKNDLSNSFKTERTEKFHPLKSTVTDITPVIEDEEQNNNEFGKSPRCQGRSPPLNRKLTLSQGLENIKYSSIKHSDHVPSENISNKYPQLMKENYHQPESLTNISLKKLLSLPCGPTVVHQLINSDCNIFGSNRDHGQSSLYRLRYWDAAKCVNSLHNQTTVGHRPNIWVGVPTEENPKLLVCLSPSQQESQVNTSADKLLDLHTKYLNRTRCQTESKVQCASPLLYHFTYDPLEAKNNHHSESKRANSKNTVRPQTCDFQEDYSKLMQYSDWIKLARDTLASDLTTDINCNTNEKIETTLPAVSPMLYQFTLDQTPEHLKNVMTNDLNRNVVTECHSPAHNSNENEDRLKLTQVCDWLKLARRNFTSDLLKDDCNHSQDKIIITKPNAAVRNRIPERHYVNSALIVRGNDSSIRNTTPLRRSPISMNSAIIDKSPTTSDSKWTPSVCKRSWDFRHNVNPVLIDDKPSVPVKAKRIVTVDRSCIDTRSLFDNRQSPIKVADTSQLKRVTAAEIMDNLKQLQASLAEQVNVQSGHSMPQRYFEEQLEFIEKLEKQLKKVVLADEDSERKGQVCDKLQKEENQTFINKLKDTETMIQNSDNNEKKDAVTRRKISSKNHPRFFRNTTQFENLGENRMKSDIPKRPKSTGFSAPTNGEVFRQMMFDEYINKVLEREERKHLNVVKISSRTDLDKQESKPNMSKVELEFILKAKTRLQKFGIELDEDESDEKNDECNESVDRDSGAEAKCLVDGKEVMDAKSLPKHLREFLKISRITEDENDVGEWSRFLRGSDIFLR